LWAAIGGASWTALRPHPAAPAPGPVHVTPATLPPTEATTRPQSAPTTAPPVQTVVVSERSTPAVRPRPAKKEYALLTVASEPWGTLYLENKEIGPTPIADYPLPVGTHRLRIEQEGYRTKIETIVVTGPNPIRRRYSLEPAGPP
jgi:hypothetical protein